MGFVEDPLSSLWFNILMLVLPLVIFLASIYITRRNYEEENREPEEKTQVMVY
ncbi:MAG: hypothetical protein HXS50_00025 [Theionarchaea archaeon]|nr:hypothetical protein [Theionarchaea archaeon]